MRSLETLDPTKLYNLSERVVLVGTSTYQNYKYGELETEAILILKGSRHTGDPDWDGMVDARVSIARSPDGHSGRQQSSFQDTSIHHPEPFAVGETLLLKGSTEVGSDRLYGDVSFTIASMQVR